MPQLGVLKFENKPSSELIESIAYSSNPVDIRAPRLKSTNVNNYRISQLTSLYLFLP